jgi:hypothetical protein
MRKFNKQLVRSFADAGNLGQAGTHSNLFQQAAIFVVPESCSLTNRLFV